MPDKIPKLLRGHLIGTNRGSFFVRIQQKKDILKATALFKDEASGPAILSLHGKLSALQMEMRLDDFWSPGLIRLLNGNLTLNFTKDFTEAEGKWETDMGTSGICKVSAVSGAFLGIKWWASIFTVKLSFFLRKYFPFFYTLLLFITAALDVFEVVKITYPTLIILLIPSPYIYRTHLGLLINAYKIRRIGPVELEQQLSIDRTIATTTHPFKVLDQFFVNRTKILLYWLNQKSKVTIDEFIEYAKQIGVLTENIDTTRQALIITGCATSEQNNIITTDFGKQYIAYLNRLTSGAST